MLSQIVATGGKMSKQPNPEVNKWFKDNENGQLFEVVALDESDETIEIQFFDGSLEELDYDLDGDVDLHDFDILATAWLCNPGDANWNPACDISVPSDGTINIKDLDTFINHWLNGIEP